MKRLGVQKSVVVTRDVVVNAVYSLFFTLIACFAIWGALLKDTIGVEVLILFAFLNQCQIILRQVILGHIVDK